MTSTATEQRAADTDSTKLPLRKRKIEQCVDPNAEYGDSTDRNESIALPSLKKTKSIAILDAALSLVDMSDSNVKPKAKNEVKFPEMLMKILSSDKYGDSVRWVKNENLFFFVDSKKFAEEVLPLFFKKTKFSSFTRRLSRWGFRQIKGGPHSGCFYHNFFCRENKELCRKIKIPGHEVPEIDISSNFNYSSDKQTLPLLSTNTRSHHHSMKQLFSHDLTSLNNPIAVQHRSGLANISDTMRFGPTSNLMEQYKRAMYGHVNNHNTSQMCGNDKLCRMRNGYYNEYLGALKSRNSMIRNLMSKGPTRETHTRTSQILMGKELLRAKLKTVPGSFPYILGSGQQVSNLPHSHVPPKKSQTPFQYYEKLAHRNKLDNILGGSLSVSSESNNISTETDSSEIIRRAVQVLYNS